MKTITTFLQKKFLRIPWSEWLAILFFFGGLFILLAKVAGGPTTSDEFFYMNLSINGIKSYLVLDYYFHIYFQRLFLLAAPSALAGAKYFWAFLIASTSLMIYLGARWISKGNQALKAILSVALFLSISTFAQFSGTPKVDFTATWVVALIVTVCIVYREFKVNRKAVLILLGFLFVLALKTKETALLSGVVLIGFGFDENSRFRFGEWLKSLLYLLPGILLGGLFFVLLNWLCVRDPLFGIRPQDYATYFQMTVGSNRFLVLDQNWLSDFAIKVIPIPFLLYLGAGFTRLRQKTGSFYRFTWLYPILLLGFLIVVMLLTSGYNIVQRNFFPALPVICLFASQAFEDGMGEDRRFSKLNILWIGLGLALAIIFQQLIQHTSKTTGWNFTDFSQNILVPLVLLVVIAWMLFKQREGKGFGLMVTCLSLGISCGLVSNFKSIVVDRPVAFRVSQMFYPYSAFKNSIHFSNGAVYYISPTLPAHLQMLARDKDEIFTMFNIYFKANSTEENFIFPAKYNNDTGDYQISTDPVTSLAAMNYDQAIIADEDWQRVDAEPGMAETIEAQYQILADDTGTILLLTRK